MFDDPSIDAVVIATPDHWHGPATIMACRRGKHVYVEKPCCHNPREGELMIAAARKHNRVVQVGTQRRSMPGTAEAIERVKAGEIGNVLFARGWYNADRKPIGMASPRRCPRGSTTRCGKVPRRTPYRDNVVHYNWHWFWHWGTGELGNNGIHSLDICRWGLGVDYPTRVTAGGGKYFFDDDQETPDTQVVTWDFGDKAITWEGRNWHTTASKARRSASPSTATRVRWSPTATTTRSTTAGGKLLASSDQGVWQPRPAHQELPGVRPLGRAPCVRHRRSSQEHAAVSPGEHRLSHGEHAQLRSGDGAHPRQRSGRSALGPRVSPRLGADRLTGANPGAPPMGIAN